VFRRYLLWFILRNREDTAGLFERLTFADPGAADCLDESWMTPTKKGFQNLWKPF